MDVRLPQLGEGADSGVVVSVAVKVGDQVERDQTIIELENEKAVAPIPATSGGQVTHVHVKEGDKVSVGQVLISVADQNGSSAQASAQAVPQAVPQATVSAQAPKATLSTSYVYHSQAGVPPPASPSVRKVARDLGIDLTRVKGSERGGRITLQDLKAYVHQIQQLAFGAQAAAAPQSSGVATPAPVSVDFSKWGPVRKEKLSSLRKTIAKHMTENWQTIPHVTQMDEANITQLMALRKKYAAKYEQKKAKLTLTSFAIKAVLYALQKCPNFNASLDETTNELVLKDYYHLGIAVDTEQGLIVPVMRDVNKKSLLELSKELQTLATKTRERKVSAEDLKGGTFTISNLGGIGGTHFTPIINKPEVAILGLGRGFTRVAIVKGKKQTNIILPLAVSYDHRVIDGANGARFIRALAEGFENFKEKDVKI